MNILDVLLIVGCIVLYLIAGNAVLYLIDERLSEWVYNAPNTSLFMIVWIFWPVVVIVYYAQPRRD